MLRLAFVKPERLAPLTFSCCTCLWWLLSSVSESGSCCTSRSPDRVFFSQPTGGHTAALISSTGGCLSFLSVLVP
ncbi:hypothetical protein B0T13DRAFT_481792 [Neurospora crassa]|nr:hypothetical protein B0T13DRAFT_481792 [Neurospora crassa]